jgi:predicted type IV restriction endonuclease
MQAYYIVKSILRENLDIKRIYIRDKKNYCGILLDDNNRKPICRLYFNSKKKYLGLFSDNKNEEKVVIEDLNDIYMCTDKLKITVNNYDNNKIQVD